MRTLGRRLKCEGQAPYAYFHRGREPMGIIASNGFLLGQLMCEYFGDLMSILRNDSTLTGRALIWVSGNQTRTAEVVRSVGSNFQLKSCFVYGLFLFLKL